MSPIAEGPFALHHGDCLEVLQGFSDDSIDAVVTDPPYGLGDEPDALAMLTDWLTTGHHDVKGRGFMKKEWDSFVPQPVAWKELYRVLKPGAHIVVFGGTRTYDLVTLGLRIAGFEIRDCLSWLYGSGFPKSHNLAGEWDGWGTALKPAWEPIILARKPFIGTVAATVAKHGTGALNIDACRVGEREHEKRTDPKTTSGTYGPINSPGGRLLPPGRWPANVAHDGSEEVMKAFPKTSSGKPGVRRKPHETGSMSGALRQTGEAEIGYGDSGSAARFFYCAKSSRSDRENGLESFDIQDANVTRWSGDGMPLRQNGTERKQPRRRNHHPTVKPTALMQWLCRLVTPPGGVILDPYTGSGSTGRGAVLEGFRFIGIEKENDFLEIALARIGKAASDARADFDRSQLSFFDV